MLNWCKIGIDSICVVKRAGQESQIEVDKRMDDLKKALPTRLVIVDFDVTSSVLGNISVDGTVNLIDYIRNSCTTLVVVDLWEVAI